MSVARTRRELLGVRAAIVLPTLVALLSLATGIANISAGVTSGPLSTYIPAVVQQTAGFTGTLTGFVLLLTVEGLRRRLRVSWYGTVALLPITGVQGLVQASIYSLPLVVLSALSMPTLLLHRNRFDRSATLSTTQTAAILALSGTLTYGTIGTYALREEYGNVTSLTDAFYYTVVTASTVGYGDVVPLTDKATLFAVSVVVLGTASFAVALGSVLGPAIEARFAHALGTMTDTQYDLYEDHVIVLGYGDLTAPLLDELGDSIDFVVVTDDRARATELRDQDIDVFVGDPSDDEPLLAVGIEHARAVIVATNNDAEDAFAILTARELNPGCRIVAGATARDNIEKLRRAGADTVLSAAVIGGRLLVRSALGEDDIEGVADQILDEEENG
jgi:voltage-gated potassium channel